MLYRSLWRPLLYALPAETAHLLAVRGARVLSKMPGACWFVRRCLGYSDEAIRVRALGLDLPSPVGLAAGFDKEAQAHEMLGALGFGFVEVGTITAQPQPGNPKPRLFRLPADRALVNRMGFNNRGAEDVARRLQARARRIKSNRPRPAVLGINIGKTKVVPEEAAAADYARSAELLAPYADYLAVNVSSPNTPGLRDLQAVERLRPLLEGVRTQAQKVCPERNVPVLVKIAPDLADQDVDAVADLALELSLEGIIATNTTIGRGGLTSATKLVDACGAGGLSGAPLKRRSLQVLRRLRSRVGNRLTLVSVGGIETPDDAWERILAGATLVQVYTALVYEGPFLPRALGKGLAERVRRHGMRNIAEAVGTQAGSQA